MRTAFLLFVALTYIGFGAFVVVNPAPLFEFFRLDPATLDLRLLNDLRAVYGGLNVGLGVWFLYTAIEAPRHRAGLITTALVVGGYLLGRIAGFVADGIPDGALLAFVAFEVVLLGLALILLATLRKRPAQ